LKYDAVVVGGGPAGLICSKIMAEQGCKVLLVEMRKKIAKMHRADGEMIHNDPGLRGDTVALEDGQIKFTVHGFSVPYRGPRYDLYHYIVESPSGYRVHLANFHPPIGIVISREELLRGMEKEALDAGVEIRCETMALQAENTSQGARVNVKKKDGSTEWIEARYIVAADGMASRIVRTSFPIIKPGGIFGSELAAAGEEAGTQIEMANTDWPYKHTFWKCVGKVFKSSVTYCWPTAKRNIYVLADTKKATEYFISESKFAKYFRNANRIRALGWPRVEPINPLWYPLNGNILAVGEAALGSMETLYQGAILMGWAAGKVLARAINNGVHVSRYLDDYITVMRKHEIFRHPNPFDVYMEWGPLISSFTKIFEDDEIDALFKVVDGEVIEGGLDPTRQNKYMWIAIFDKKDQLEKIKPGLLNKIRAIMEKLNKELGTNLRWNV